MERDNKTPDEVFAESAPMAPIELIHKTNCSFIQGYIIESISAYNPNLYNAKVYLKRCITYAKIAIKIGSTWNCHDFTPTVRDFAVKNKISTLQRVVIQDALLNSYQSIIDRCQKILDEDE